MLEVLLTVGAASVGDNTLPTVQAVEGAFAVARAQLQRASNADSLPPQVAFFHPRHVRQARTGNLRGKSGLRTLRSLRLQHLAPPFLVLREELGRGDVPCERRKAASERSLVPEVALVKPDAGCRVQQMILGKNPARLSGVHPGFAAHLAHDRAASTRAETVR